jgi:hypothetical protein
MPWAQAQLKEVSQIKSPRFRSDGSQHEVMYIQSEENEEDGFEIECEMVGQSGLSSE